MTKRFASIIGCLGCAALFCVAGSALAEPQGDVRDEPVSLGLVTATEPVEVASEDVASPLSSFAYFSGQRIATSSDDDARLVLTLDDGSLALGPDAAAVVTGTPGRYRVTLEKGVMTLRFGASADFEVAADEVRVRRLSGAPEQLVEAALQLLPSGDVSVVSHRGSLEAVDGRVEGTSVIEPGQLARFGGEGPPDVAADGESVGWLTRLAYGAGGLAVFGGAAGLAVGLGGDGGDGSSASPM